MLRYILGNLPAFIVVLPLMVAPVMAMISPRQQYARSGIWYAGFLSVAFIFFAACYLFVAVYQGGAFSYLLGGWAVPLGIEYEITPLNSMLLLLISFIALVILPYGKISVEREVAHKKAGLFWCMFMLLLGGLLGMVITNDIFNIYVFLEIASLAAYALVALGQDKRALTAAFNYLIVGTIGGILFLTGIAFLYAKTGSLNISDISYQLGVLNHSKLEVAALVFMFIGLGIKAGIVPLAGWLPRVYQFAPSFVAVFLSAVATKVALYLMAKILFVLFGREFSLGVLGLGHLLIMVGLIAVVFGSLAAIYQTDFRRMLAFSAMANIGVIVVGIGLGTGAAVAAAILHFITHALAKAGLFMIITNQPVRGLGKTNPLYAALLVLFGLSMAGVPLTVGFLSKWQLLVASFGVEGWGKFAGVLVVVSSSALALLYVGRLLESCYYHKPVPAENVQRSCYIATSLISLAVVMLLFGVMPDLLFDFAQNTAKGFAK